MIDIPDKRNKIISIIILVIAFLLFATPIVSVGDIEKRNYTSPKEYKSIYTWDGKLIMYQRIER